MTDDARKLRELLIETARQRDALLAAVKQIAACFTPVEPGYTWPGIEMRNIGPAAQAILAAIALCEKGNSHA